MTRGLVFWIIMLVWLVFGVAWHFSLVGTYGPIGFVLLFFILFALLGWQVFGPPIHG
jgi:hypothetical protein